MELIDRYKDMPEGRSKKLLSRLPGWIQDGLTVSVEQKRYCSNTPRYKISSELPYTEIVRLEVVVDGQVVTPADCIRRSILTELEEIVRKEYYESWRCTVTCLGLTQE